MPRTTFLYLAAVLLPCAVLAWLGWRSAGQEAAAAQARRVAGWQQSADAAAQRAQAHMERRAREFGDAVESLAGRAERADPGRTAAWLHSRSPAGEAVFVLDTSSGALQWADGKAEITDRESPFLTGKAESACALVAFGEPVDPAETFAGLNGREPALFRGVSLAAETADETAAAPNPVKEVALAEMEDRARVVRFGGGGSVADPQDKPQGSEPDAGEEMAQKLQREMAVPAPAKPVPAPAAEPAPAPAVAVAGEPVSRPLAALPDLVAAAKRKPAVEDRKDTPVSDPSGSLPGVQSAGGKAPTREKLEKLKMDITPGQPETEAAEQARQNVDNLMAADSVAGKDLPGKKEVSAPAAPFAKTAQTDGAPAQTAAVPAPAAAPAPAPEPPAAAAPPLPVPGASAPAEPEQPAARSESAVGAAPARGAVPPPDGFRADSAMNRADLPAGQPPGDAPAEPRHALRSTAEGKAKERQARAADKSAGPVPGVVDMLPDNKPAAPPDGAGVPAGGSGPDPQSRGEGPAGTLSRAVAPVHATPGQPSASSVPLIPLRFPQITAASRGGITSRVEQGTLRILFWHRPSWRPHAVVGMLLSPQALLTELQSVLPSPSGDGETQLRLAGHGLSSAGEMPATAPVVAREIGPALPLWEAAVFLTNPAALTAAGDAARWQLALALLAVLAAGVAGAMLLLRDARRTALDARQKVDFVSSVSHELKTPLTSIRMFSDLLATQPDAPAEKRQRYARTIAAEAARLSRLIGNVLNFARLERGAHRLNPELLDVRDLCTRTLESMAPALEQEGFSVAVLLPEEPVMLTADQDALSQILVNLLSNAQKYGKRPDGAAPGEISLTLSAMPGQVLLSVADRGPGVPAGQEEKIFRQFHRADDAMTSGASGSGLGLTISRALARAHGGNLTCSPRDGGGAVFRLALPLRLPPLG